MAQPPLKAIHGFCLAAQHLSIKRAAAEMAVTPGAVSQQIRVLEAWLGFTLFERRARSIVLTEPGYGYYRRMAPLLEELVGVSQSMRQHDRLRAVHLSVPPGFALRCLGPRLNDLRRRYSEVELHLNVSATLHTLPDSGQHLAIRYLSAADAELDCTALTNLMLMPVCSPGYLERSPSLASPDWKDVTLIHDQLHQDWQHWLQQAGITDVGTQHLHVDQATLALQAAEQGLGVALGDDLLAADALRSGDLVIANAARLPAFRRLYLAHPRSTPLSAATRRCKQWIVETFCQMD